MKLIAGAHMSMVGGFPQAAEEAGTHLQANAMQIFLKSPRGGKPRDVPEEEIAEFKKLCKKFGIAFVMGHASYLLNFAKPLHPSDWQFENIEYDVRLLQELGGHGLALHIGKFLDRPKEEAISFLVENLETVLKKTSDCSVPILLENGAGQGSEIGVHFEEIAEIFRALGKPKRIRFCLDVCHCFAAGYDVHTKEGVKNWTNEWEKNVGWDYVAAIHCNDAKGACGSHLDRHENIGKGNIGNDGIREIAHWAAKKSIPLILETPMDGDGHKKDLEVLRGLAGVKI